MQMQQTMSKSAAPRGELRTCALRCGGRDVPESNSKYQIDSTTQPRISAAHDNNIICLSRLSDPPFRSLAPVECVAGHRLVGEACLDFWKTALNRSGR